MLTLLPDDLLRRICDRLSPEQVCKMGTISRRLHGLLKERVGNERVQSNTRVTWNTNSILVLQKRTHVSRYLSAPAGVNVPLFPIVPFPPLNLNN